MGNTPNEDVNENVISSKPYAQQQQQGVQEPQFLNQSVPKPQVEEDAYSSKREFKRKTGKKMAYNQVEQLPQSSMMVDWNVEKEDAIDSDKMKEAVRKAYGGSAQVEIDSNSREGNKQNFKCRVYFSNSSEAEVAYQRNEMNDSALQQVIAEDLGIQGSTLAFDNPSKPHSVEKLTLQLDSDSSSILCGACLIYQDTKLLKVVHYSDRNYGHAIVHSGDTSVDGKSVHTIKLNMAALDATVTQLFFTLCACGPADLSAFLNPYIALFETEKPDVNLIQYTIAQAGKSQSCVMVRLFRSGKSDWSIQALGSEQWNLKAKVCMAYHHASRLIDAHLKANQSNAQTPHGHGQGEVPQQAQAQQQNVAPPQQQGEGVLESALEAVPEVEGEVENYD